MQDHSIQRENATVMLLTCNQNASKGSIELKCLFKQGELVNDKIQNRGTKS